MKSELGKKQKTDRMVKVPSEIYQLKVTLRGIKPPIWRRIAVPGDIKLDKLHKVLQLSMGWFDCHLHEFRIYGNFYTIPHAESNPDDRNERRAPLNMVIRDVGERLDYTYDFGDGWEHSILVEKIDPPQPDIRYPVCLGGKRACPPENCGDYENFLAALNDPNHEQHEEFIEWIGGSFDPEEFDIEEVNKLLRSKRF
jgi:hypothetical protein